VVVGRSAVLVVALAAACTSTAPAPEPPPGVAPVTVPALVGWTPAAGEFRLTPESRIVVDPEQGQLHDEARTLAGDVAGVIGRPLPVVALAGTGDAGDLVLRLDGERSELGEEGYALSVGRTVTVTARTGAGVFYGTRTVLQLLLAGGALPAGAVTDVPRYPERGVGVCACVAPVSVEWLRRIVMDAAYLKLNHLWLELKIKSDALPDPGGWGYYTRAEVAALQELAARYHVTVVPEVDAPGHMGPWLHTRPDLWLVTADGVPNPNNLDVSAPGALTFVTGIIDEYLAVFDTPFWHLGADEYLLGDDYAKYPRLLDHARARYGEQAVAQDAFVDFVNRVNAHVKGKGKRLRIWNDGLTGVATVPLDGDIVIEHWRDGRDPPSTLVGRGHTLMNAASSLYNVRGGPKIDTAALYAGDWSPLVFEGETLPATAAPMVTGAKITLWPDDASAETENEIEAQIYLPLRFIAQATWGPTRPDPDFAAFTRRADTAGRAPGLATADPNPIRDGTVTLSAGGRFLAPVDAAEGATLTATAAATEWRLDRTADGYRTIRHAATGRCVQAPLGARDLSTPLQTGTPITAEACTPANRLQRWQLTRTGDAVTLTNAITRMVAVLDGTLLQQPPDSHPPTAFTLVE